MYRDNGRARTSVRADRLMVYDPTHADESLGELIRRLGSDTSALIQQEAALAKAEAREAAGRIGRDSARVGIAAGLAFIGVLALSAFLVLALGRAMGGAYWLSSLLVGVAATVTGVVMARSAVQDMKRGFTPHRTIETLREGKAWATREARELKHNLTTTPATARR
jgi:hypothetical protein